MAFPKSQAWLAFIQEGGCTETHAVFFLLGSPAGFCILHWSPGFPGFTGLSEAGGKSDGLLPSKRALELA